MRPQEHIKLSAIAATIAWPWLKWDIWIPFSASILIDTDHYLWYALSQRNLSLRAAVRYYRKGLPPQRPEVRLLHQPAVLGFLLLLAVYTRSRLLGLILGGLFFHVSVDRFHKAQTRKLRDRLNVQADAHCQQCGQPEAHLEVHTIHRPKSILDQYNPDNFVLLCPTCHRQIHTQKKKLRQTV